MFDGITEFEVQVKPEDLDELNHVNNVVYMRWLEMAARAGSADAGLPTERYFREGLGAWVVRKHWIEYLRDCKLGDIIVRRARYKACVSAVATSVPSKRMRPFWGRIKPPMIRALRNSALRGPFAICPRRCERRTAHEEIVPDL